MLRVALVVVVTSGADPSAAGGRTLTLNAPSVPAAIAPPAVVATWPAWLETGETPSAPPPQPPAGGLRTYVAVRGEPSVGESIDWSVAVAEKPFGPVTSRSLLS